MTHAQLVARAERWLREEQLCPVVLVEAKGAGGETPDAIGFSHLTHESCLVECKATRADFLDDARKPFRMDPWMGVGRWRYYLVPEGLIPPEGIPERWGLLVLGPDDRVRTIIRARRWDADARGDHRGVKGEMGLLLSELAKIQVVARGGTLLPSASARRVESLVAAMEASR